MRSPIMLPYSMYPALSRSTLVPRDLLRKRNVAPEDGVSNAALQVRPHNTP